jgi:hypothetical protein
MINPPQQRGPLPQVGVIFDAVESVDSSGIYVSRHRGLLDVGIMPPEPANDFAAVERLIQLADALLEHGPYSHDHIVRGPVTQRTIEWEPCFLLPTAQVCPSCHDQDRAFMPLLAWAWYRRDASTGVAGAVRLLHQGS